MTAFPPKTPKPSTAEPTEPTDTASAQAESGVSEGFHRDVEAALGALASLLQRLRRIRRPPAARTASPTVSSAEMVARLQLGLKKEHDLVLAPLLGRLDAFATRLVRGADIPIPAIQEGLALVDRYLHELHDVHLRLLELSGPDPDKGEPALLAFQQLASDYEHARVRWATVRVMMRTYEEKVLGSRSMLGLTLAQECRAEQAWHDFEEEYARANVPAKFLPKVAETWRVELDRVRDAGRADRTRIEDWVERTTQYVPGIA
ncbi:MAG TPA: hypothetical protein VN842_04120 [Thermoplasmata archaeon]|nr:hypothetical protein [Thermoplasmata archaeon]